MENSLPPAIFIAGPLGLDFLNSLARPIVEVVDWLGNGSDFLSWMKQAGLLTVDELAVVKSSMSSQRNSTGWPQRLGICETGCEALSRNIWAGLSRLRP
jgi:hypothetical protein